MYNTSCICMLVVFGMRTFNNNNNCMRYTISAVQYFMCYRATHPT